MRLKGNGPSGLSLSDCASPALLFDLWPPLVLHSLSLLRLFLVSWKKTAVSLFLNAGHQAYLSFTLIHSFDHSLKRLLSI